MSMISDDPRIDPRIKAVFGPLPTFPMPSFESREDLVAAMNSPEALAALDAMSLFSEEDAEAVAHLRLD